MSYPLDTQAIRELLRARKLRQKDLATVLGVSQEQVSRILTGYSGTTEKNARVIAKKLKVDLSDITSHFKLSPMEAALVRLFRELDPVTQAEIVMLVKQRALAVEASSEDADGAHASFLDTKPADVQ